MLGVSSPLAIKWTYSWKKYRTKWCTFQKAMIDLPEGTYCFLIFFSHQPILWSSTSPLIINIINCPRLNKSTRLEAQINCIPQNQPHLKQHPSTPSITSTLQPLEPLQPANETTTRHRASRSKLPSCARGVLRRQIPWRLSDPTHPFSGGLCRGHGSKSCMGRCSTKLSSWDSVGGILWLFWPHKTLTSYRCCLAEGSLEVKLPTVRTDGKAEVGRVREEKSKREKIREEKE